MTFLPSLLLEEPFSIERYRARSIIFRILTHPRADVADCSEQV
jgi:hypothetical protein